MSRKFLTSIDLAKNEIQNGVVQNLASAPTAPVKGQLYFNSTGGDNTLYWWDGTGWVPAKATGGAFPGYGAVLAESTYGIAKSDGAATTVARSDHTHGTPALPPHNALTATADVAFSGFKLTGVGTPTAGTDATTKDYVDNLSAGLSWKDAVRVATVANIANFNTNSVDGITVATGERVLVKNQTTASANGIYYYNGASLARASDADTGAELEGATVFVSEGTHADQAWMLTTNAPITLGTTALTWVQFGAGTAYTAGNGMTLTGSTLDVVGDTSIWVYADNISRAALSGDVTASAGSNTTAITLDAVTNAKLADMATGTIKGRSTLGTGDPQDLTAPQLRTLLGYAQAVPFSSVGGATSQVLTHNLGSNYVTVEVFRATVPYDTIECDVERTTIHTVTLRFVVAPSANEYQAVVIG